MSINYDLLTDSVSLSQLLFTTILHLFCDCLTSVLQLVTDHFKKIWLQGGCRCCIENLLVTSILCDQLPTGCLESCLKA